MANNDYLRQYQRDYRSRKRQITLTLDPEEFEAWKRRADDAGRKVGQQILAEAASHRDQRRLPTGEEESALKELLRVMREIGTNLNQVAHNSNRFARLLEDRHARQLLAQLEDAADAFLRRDEGKIDP